MFFQQLPFLIQCLILFTVGSLVGSLVNLAIYQLADFNPRSLSPWSPTTDATRSRTRADRLPIIGWYFLRRESTEHGRGFWIRPLLIELGIAIGLVWFYFWQTSGGLFDNQIDNLVKNQQELAPVWTHTWFYFHSVLFVLMVVASFIDFDEQTIPDWITVPGTLFALTVMTLAPSARLPVINPTLSDAIKLSPLTFTDPGAAAQWQTTWIGCVVAILIMVAWCFALIPKWATLRLGLIRGVWLMWVSILNPPRKTQANVPQQPRHMRMATKVCGLIAVLSVIIIVAVWYRGGTMWNGLFDSLLGLAMGGGIVWSVRIIAGQALQTEAMGFGDVTLMCMIGAAVGWQPALLIFIFAPFTSIVVALAQLLTSGEQKLAFGPYLCLGAAILIFGWSFIWNEWAAPNVFVLGGGFLLGVIVVCLVLMAGMLGVWGLFKYRE